MDRFNLIKELIIGLVRDQLIHMMHPATSHSDESPVTYTPECIFITSALQRPTVKAVHFYPVDPAIETDLQLTVAMENGQIYSAPISVDLSLYNRFLEKLALVVDDLLVSENKFHPNATIGTKEDTTFATYVSRMKEIYRFQELPLTEFVFSQGRIIGSPDSLIKHVRLTYDNEQPFKTTLN